MNDFHLYDLFNIITLINHFKNKYQLLVTENSVSAVCVVSVLIHNAQTKGIPHKSMMKLVLQGENCITGYVFTLVRPIVCADS